MTLREYIKHLKELESQGYGDFPLIYAKDEEGNAYHKLLFEPGLIMVEDLEEYYLETVHPDDVDEYVPNAILIN